MVNEPRPDSKLMTNWSNSILSYSKKDVSEAILKKKKAPHKLLVEESKQDDNSVVEMT